MAKAAAALAALRKLDANGYLDGHLLPPKPEPDQQVVAEIEEEQSFFAAALPELWSQASPWGSSLQDGPDVTYLNVIERSGKAQPIALLTRYAFPREIRVPLFVNGTNLEFFSVRTVWSGEIAKETLDVAAQWSALVWNTVLKQQEQSLNQVGDDDMTDPMDIEETRWASDMVIDVQPSKDPGSAAILLVALADDADWPIDLEKMRLHVGYAANPASLPELLARSEEADLLRMLPELVVEDTVGAHPSKYRILRKCEGLRPLEPLPNAKKPDTLVCSTYLKAHGLLAADVEPNQPVYIARRLPRKIDFLQPDRSKHQHPHAKNPQQAVPSPQNGESAQPEKRDSIFDGFIKSSDRLVFPQFLKVNPLENDIVNCAFVLPSVIEFLKLFLLAKEFNDRNDLFFGDKPEELVPAMTLARDSLVGLKESNLERLEFLGDAHIKAFVTMRTFVKDKMHMQGSLTRRRNFLVSNKYLGRKIVAMDPQWPSTIAAGKSVLKWREWRPPHVSRGSDEPLVELSIKAIADSVEAVAGACYLKDEKLADQWLSRVFLLDPEMPGREEAEAFILQQCGLAPGQDGTANLELHPKLTRVALVEDILGYKFRNKLLCLSALTHESAVDTTVRSYERLEFLGDAILSTLVTSYLFAEFSAASPGVLSALREVLVCNGLLAMLCVRLDLHIHLDHGSGALLHAIGEYLEDLAELDVHPPDSPVQDPDFAHLIPDPKLRWMSLQAPKALADMIESLLGAVFLDSGFDVHETERVFRGSLLPAAQKCYDPHRPPRHPVQMIVQVVLARRCQGLVFEYDPVARDDGSLDGTPTHFICRVMHHDVKLASASARSKKFARREAATRCLEELGAHGMRILEVAKCDCQESKKVGDEEDEEEGDEVVMKEFGLEGNERAKDLWEDLRDMEF